MFVYYTVDEVREELERRAPLRAQVEAWWMEQGFGIPNFPRAERPLGQFCRAIATTRFEDILFQQMAERAGLTPLWSELYADTFSTDSSFKKACIDRRLVEGVGRSGGLKIRREKLFTGNIRRFSGMPMEQICTSAGEGLIAFHHRKHAELFGATALRRDFSAWIKGSEERSAREYYLRYLSFFVAHTVLFEDYDGGQSGGKLKRFLARTVSPAYQELNRLFGVAPLFVAMPWENAFNYYPGDGVNWRSLGVIPKNLLNGD